MKEVQGGGWEGEGMEGEKDVWREGRLKEGREECMNGRKAGGKEGLKGGWKDGRRGGCRNERNESFQIK